MIDKDELLDALTQAAVEKIEDNRDDNKPDWDALGADTNEAVGIIHKRFKGKGGPKKIKQGQNAAQKMKNSGQSQKKRDLAGIKRSKAFRKMGAGKKRKANILRAKAMKKRGDR